MPSSIVPRPFGPEVRPAGTWDFFIVPDRGRVVGIVDAGTGPIAVIAANGRDRNMVRLYAPGGDGWEPITDWVGPFDQARPDAVERVRWTSASVLDGSIVITAQESGPDRLPRSVVFDPASGSHDVGSNDTTGEGQVRVKQTAAGGDSLVAITRARGVVVWDPQSGADWNDATPPDGWPKGTTRLTHLTHGDGIWAIGAHRRQGGTRTDFLVTSRNGHQWEATDFGGSGGGGIRELEALGNDGSTFLALGRDEADRLVTQASSDGTTWSTPQPADPGVFGDAARLESIVSYPEGTFLAGGASYNTDYRHCYVAGRACGISLEMVWMAQEGAWRSIGAPSGLRTTAVALIDDVLYLGGEYKGSHSTGSHWRITSWIPEEPGTIPFVVMPADELPAFDAPLIADDGDLDPGVTYAWVGCEGCARFNGHHWHVASVTDDAAVILGESGAMGSTHHSCWAGPGELAIYGTVELVSPWRIEWSIPGYGPIAYLRAGDEVSGLVGCAL